MLLKFFWFATIFAITVQGCVSSGDSPIESEHDGRVLELKSNRRPAVLDEKFIETYLKTFGYLLNEQENVTSEESGEKEISKEKLQNALITFQEFMGIPGTGNVDAQTSSLMMRKRCGNADIHPSTDILALWKKSVVTWNITHFPKTVKESDLREQLHQAFAAWEIVISMDFVEVDRADKADIVFSFEDSENDWQRDPTHLTIARASGPISSRVWISADEHWGINNELEQTGTDLFNVLVHEIGHVLGMRHSPDSGSMMHPLFERSMNQDRPVVTPDDVERLRNLYNVADPQQQSAENDPTNLNETSSTKCIKSIQSATHAPDGRWLVFKDDKVWQTLNHTVMTKGIEIFQVLPSAPTYVNASATVGDLMILISDRQIFGYRQTKRNGQFEPAEGYPKELHSRVLFYPEAAFPLTNGSIILLSDNVFATYDLENNAPTFLNDKNVYFPNLPENLVSGIPQIPDSDNVYWMLTDSDINEYDARIQQILNSESLTTFFTCDF
uniref:Peptidase metallopeptidase domain-containing protein n=1 Tax=Panagrolaimus sp. PS1159 TaxID=55785 RepID=A0AC35GCD8_9BILA